METTKGFLLEQELETDQNIIVLTGRNGSGKTRLLESIQHQRSEVTINGSKAEGIGIRFLGLQSLQPNFGSHYNDAQYSNRVTSALNSYASMKSDLELPFNPRKSEIYGGMARENGLDHSSLYRMFHSIAKKLNKNVISLTQDDIISYFEEPISNILGSQNISLICNQYIKRKNNNLFNEWKSTEKGFDVDYLSDEEFINQFGEKPWVLLNRILESIFEGKFKFENPNEDSQSYDYQAKLLHSSDDSVVTLDSLSSGEKTLLWLAITLFNSSYYDSDVVSSPKLLLIDEPDAYLHPKMVDKMYQVFNSYTKNYDAKVILSTHSPTTVALAPEDSLFIVDNNTATAVSKDQAISELLDGISQIAISPENRRQVFVESINDVDIYDAIYRKMSSSSKLLDNKISLSFVSSGPKMPEQQIIDKAKSILKIADENLLKQFIESINGVGSCSQVYGQVESLTNKGNSFVRGIVDYDKKNNPKENVTVLGKGSFYSIENIILDPICILLLLHLDKPDVFKMTDICNEDIHWTEWLERKDLLQVSLNNFIYKVLNIENSKDAELVYASSLSLQTDSKYLMHQGHSLEREVINAYPRLKAFKKQGKEGALKLDIVLKSMINYTNGKFIPKAFEDTFADVQK